MNRTIFILTIFFVHADFLKYALSISLLNHDDAQALKIEQWGVNQERVKVVPRDEFETSNQHQSPEKVTVKKSVLAEALEHCNCGKCAKCELKSLLLKQKSNGEKRNFYDSSVFNANPYGSYELFDQTPFQVGNPYLGYGQGPNLEYVYNNRFNPNSFYQPYGQIPAEYPFNPLFY